MVPRLYISEVGKAERVITDTKSSSISDIFMAYSLFFGLFSSYIHNPKEFY